MIYICGTGWVDSTGHGCIKQSISRKGKPDRKETFIHPFKNFGRLDAVSEMTCYAIGLALRDASLSYPLEDAGIVGTSISGSLDGDRDYFKKYTDSGRTLGRGNFFIYTLPSSPLGEAAIHFGLKGALLFVGSAQKHLSEAVAVGSGLIYDKEVSVVLVGMADENEALYMVLADESVCIGEPICSVEAAEPVLDENPVLSAVVLALEELKK